MNNDAILKSDLLDILFDKRNKMYGAYILRKFYPNRIKTSLCIMFLMVLLFSAFTFLPAKKIDRGLYTTIEETILKERKSEKPRVIQPKPKASVATVRSQANYSSNITIIKKDTVEKLKNIDQLAIGSKYVMNVEGTRIGDPGPEKLWEGEGFPSKPAEPIEVSEGPADNPDIQASFPGGNGALIRFLEKNLQSPKELAEEETVQVKIKFVVGFDGSLQGFDIVQDGGNEYNSEVIRVLKKMPKWNPGKKGGKNVPVYYTIPVKFISTE